MMMPTGYGGQDAWVLQLRSSGAVAWQRVYGGSSDERSHALLAVPSSGYVLLAQTASSNGWTQGTHGGEDLWVVKMSGSGTLEWQQALGGSDDSDPAGIVRNAQGEYLVAGTSLSQDGDIGLHRSVRTGFLARLAPNGNLLHTLKIGDDQECRCWIFSRATGPYICWAACEASTAACCGKRYGLPAWPKRARRPTSPAPSFAKRQSAPRRERPARRLPSAGPD